MVITLCRFYLLLLGLVKSNGICDVVIGFEMLKESSIRLSVMSKGAAEGSGSDDNWIIDVNEQSSEELRTEQILFGRN